MKKNVTIKLAKEQITIKLEEKSTYEEILEELKQKLPELKKLYKDEKTPIYITGKILENAQMEEIQEIVSSQIGVKIETDNPKELGLHGIRRVFHKGTETSQTKFYKGSLRSGQKIEYEGSIVIVGDVNSGAEVIAGENIVVLGNLRGLAHAGAKGNKGAIIVATYIETPQIRISNILKEMEKEEIYKNAYISLNQENQITIEENI